MNTYMLICADGVSIPDAPPIVAIEDALAYARAFMIAAPFLAGPPAGRDLVVSQGGRLVAVVRWSRGETARTARHSTAGAASGFGELECIRFDAG
jgi:hypothetical protein